MMRTERIEVSLGMRRGKWLSSHKDMTLNINMSGKSGKSVDLIVYLPEQYIRFH